VNKSLSANNAATVTFANAETGGSSVTDLLAADGVTPITSVTTAADGTLPVFYGPDGTTQLWAIVPGAASRRLILATDVNATYIPRAAGTTAAVAAQPFLNLADYGPDTTGVAAADTAFTAARADAVANGISLIVVRPGTYRLTQTFAHNVAGVTFLALAGKNKTVIKRDFTTGPTIDMGLASDAVLVGGGWIGFSFTWNTALTLAASDVAHLKMRSCEYCEVDILALNAVEGVQMVGGAYNTVRLSASGDYASYTSRFGLKLQKGTTVGTGTSQLVTSCDFYLNIGGPAVAGFGYPLWITGAEDNRFRGYWGQGKFASTLIEQGADNALIIDNKFDNYYIDAAARTTTYGYGVAVFGAGVPAGMTWDSNARTGGDGSAYIGNLTFGTGTIKGQSGDGNDGIYIDGSATGRTGTYTQACRDLIVSSGTTISAWGRHGVNGAGGVGTKLNGTVTGNNLAAASGSGIVVGAASVRMQVAAARSGGDPYGTNPGAQLYGVQILAGASGYLISADTDLSGNATGPYTDGANNGTILNREYDAVLGVDASLTAALANIVTIANVGPGTYLVTGTMTVTNSGVTGNASLVLAFGGGGTGTLTGPYTDSTTLQVGSTTLQWGSLSASAKLVVTAAGSLFLRGAASAGTMNAKAGDVASGTNCTGLTVIQIA
jgi:hypothetical protein